MVSEQLSQIVEKFELTAPKYFFIVGCCCPAENILRSFIPAGTCPEKLKLMLERFPEIKYVVRETDIEIDQCEFNRVFDDVFNDFFINPDKSLKLFCPNRRNVFFIRHRLLDCDIISKILRHVFGKANCVNISSPASRKTKTVVALNELIEQLVVDKNILNMYEPFKTAVSEIRQYAMECMNLKV